MCLTPGQSQAARDCELLLLVPCCPLCSCDTQVSKWGTSANLQPPTSLKHGSRLRLNEQPPLCMVALLGGPGASSRKAVPWGFRLPGGAGLAPLCLGPAPRCLTPSSPQSQSRLVMQMCRPAVGGPATLDKIEMTSVGLPDQTGDGPAFPPCGLCGSCSAPLCYPRESGARPSSSKTEAWALKLAFRVMPRVTKHTAFYPFPRNHLKRSKSFLAHRLCRIRRWAGWGP